MRTENVVDSLIWFINVLLAFAIILFAFLFILFPRKENLNQRYAAELEVDEPAPVNTDLRPTLDQFRACWKRLSEPAPPAGPSGPSVPLGKIYRLTACLPNPADSSRLQAWLLHLGSQEEKILDIGAPLEAGYVIAEVTRDYLVAEKTGTDGKTERQQLWRGEEPNGPGTGERSGPGGSEDFGAQRDPRNPNKWTVTDEERQYVLENQGTLVEEIKFRPYLGQGGAMQGVLLDDVPAGSHAARRGLQKGDIVRSVNGIALTSSEISNSLSSNDSVVKASTVSVVVERQGRTITLQFDVAGAR